MTRNELEKAALEALAVLGVALVWFIATSAHAQTVLVDSTTQTAPSGIGSFLQQWLTPGGLVAIFGTVAGLLGGLVWFTQRWKRILSLACFHAFHIVEDVGAEIEGDDGFDKSARYLREIDRWLVTNGWRPLKPGEQEIAKVLASSMHGQEIAKIKVAVAAAEAAAPALPDPDPTRP